MLSPRVAATPVLPSTGRLRPLGLDEVRITGGFWAQRQQTNSAVTLPHIAHWLEREGWIGNFDLAAAGRLPEGRRGREFADSETYKFLEAAAWELGRRPDAALEETFRSFVSRVAAAQAPDGYLSTAFGRPGQPPRWSDLAWGHELYCLGHLFQAAVARERTAPGSDDGLLGIALRAADLVCDVFGADGIPSVCGHAEVEVGLAELSRVAGEQRYLHQAQLFLERRGHHVLPEPEWGRSYFQDDVGIREATVQRGHAVRANYLAAGAVDVAVETGDAELLATLRGVWDRTVTRRTYLTGGQGSHYQDEAFGEDWELPPDRAYSETCAAIASIMFSWRLLLATGGGYADLIERTLFNVVAAAVSRDGDRFFYTNTLHRRSPGEMPDPDQASPRAFSSLRAPWFDVSCCPPNISRTLASLAGLLATVDDDGLQLHQYAACSISTSLSDGTPVGLDVDTDYPDTGTITVRLRESAARPWTLSLRVPAWAEGATLIHRTTAGDLRTIAVTAPLAQLTAAFQAGDVVELELPMTADFLRADPRVDAVRGCVAVRRGPLVYCAELPADSDADLARLVVNTETLPRYADGRVVVSASWLQVPDEPLPCDGDQFTLIPYHDWGQAGLCTMRVWLPEAS